MTGTFQPLYKIIAGNEHTVKLALQCLLDAGVDRSVLEKVQTAEELQELIRKYGKGEATS